jgi:protein-L-isoaspartate(D-aspartate) O-methyltransferase
MIDLSVRRRFFAEEIEIASNLRTARLVDALSSVAREKFLPPGPWTVRTEADLGGPPRTTPDGDARHVYHNVAIGIDPQRMLFNGQPGLVCIGIDALALKPGERVLHVGTGTGYYTAILAHTLTSSGRVVGIEADAALAARAAALLASRPWVSVRGGDASGPLGETFDAILVNAGVTHLPAHWLDALSPQGRVVVPLTASMPAGPMSNIGKGLLLLVSRTADADRFDVRVLTFVAIFSAVGIRDEALNAQLGKALAANPFPRLSRLRRDDHEHTTACWFHAQGFCFEMADLKVRPASM